MACQVKPQASIALIIHARDIIENRSMLYIDRVLHYNALNVDWLTYSILANMAIGMHPFYIVRKIQGKIHPCYIVRRIQGKIHTCYIVRRIQGQLHGYYLTLTGT